MVLFPYRVGVQQRCADVTLNNHSLNSYQYSVNIFADRAGSLRLTMMLLLSAEMTAAQ